MGLGCNAVGVTGCRIIDSPRERLVAVLTNALVPCNGRFPALVAIISMFLVTGGSGFGGALVLAACIVGGVGATFAMSKLLSVTLLRGQPSAFTLELPPFRRPQIGRVIVRSVLDRTVFVLGRAVSVAAPAGLLLWCAANIRPGGVSILCAVADVLDPVGILLGVDGAILVGLIFGLPANEIVLPVALMCYSAQSALTGYDSLTQFREILICSGWSVRTAVCVMILILFHSPCATTLLTVKKETGSVRWTIAAALVPIALGCGLCMTVNLIFGIVS